MRRTFAITLLSLLPLSACDSTAPGPRAKPEAARPSTAMPAVDWTDAKLPFATRLAAAAEERATHAVVYDAAYERIAYPMGDVSPGKGVCADEIVRAYRLLGIDLQKLVHEDMKRAFASYPKRWGLARPDSNIDHRRVPNLATFFTRKGASVPVSDDADDYLPGDVVAWALPDGRPHIGLVTAQRNWTGDRPLIMHNIGLGPQIEDRLFLFKITGHFRYQGRRPDPNS